MTPTKQKQGSYIEAVGRRKTAIARVRITKGTGAVVVNDRPIEKYFPIARLRKVALEPLTELKLDREYSTTVHVTGGGISAQADAVRHGLGRVLVKAHEDFKKRIRSAGYLTRDPRMVERKKYGLKKARRAPQWAKR